jgi:DNA-binding PadR family transcriptional regulator
MGNLYRFVEPVLLFLLKQKPNSYGYELAGEVREHALTDAKIEVAALYRTLRQLERNDCVTSEWDVEGHGPARRVYALTARGAIVVVLANLSKTMGRFVAKARPVSSTKEKPSKKPSAKRKGL